MTTERDYRPDIRHVKQRAAFAKDIRDADLPPAVRAMAEKLKKGKRDIGNRMKDAGEIDLDGDADLAG